MTESLREELVNLECVRSNEIMPNCGECIYFNSVSLYPCDNPKIDQILSLITERVKGMENPHLGNIQGDMDRGRAMGFNEAIQAVIKELK